MKIPPRRIPSDECLIYVGRKIEGDKIVDNGTPYTVHKGEWVEVLPVTSVGEAIALAKMVRLNINNPAQMAEQLEQVCLGLSKRVINWNWTGLDEKPLPKPHNKPEVIKSLTEDEIAWLAMAAQGESPGERKNELKP